MCHTLATRHEQLQCYHRLDREFLVEENVISGPGITHFAGFAFMDAIRVCCYISVLYITGETVPRSMVPSLDPSTSSDHEKFLR